MSELLDLPPEILLHIIEEIGGGELRKDVRKLTLCRKWYNSAQEIFLSGRHLRDINLYGVNINRLSDRGSYSDQRKLMHKNTRNLEMQLLGHWRDQPSGDPLGLFPDDSQGVLLGLKDREKLDNDPFVFGQRSERSALVDWQTHTLTPRLKELFGDLYRFTVLESFDFRAVQGTENNGSPIERYLTSTTIASLLNNLQQVQSLRNLTLDLCCDLNYNGIHIHMCEPISKLLPRLESVRLRLESICPRIFELADDLQPSDVRLKSLILKLHLPLFPASPASFSFKPRECDPPSSAQLRERREDMIRAALAYRVNVDAIRSRTNKNNSPSTASTKSEEATGFELFRVSYVNAGHHINLVDCLTLEDGSPLKGWPPEEFFAYEDDGSSCWFEDDDPGLMFRRSFAFSNDPN